MPKLDRYFIPEHVYFTLEGDTVVFMDLKADQYSMVVGPKTLAFNSLLSRTRDVVDRVISLDASALDADPPFRRDMILELLGNGLLTRCSVRASRPMPAHIPLPDTNLVEFCYDSDPETITARELCTFFVSAAVATWRITYQRIEAIVRSVEERNQHSRKCQKTFDLTHARRLVRIYNKLRAFVPRDYLCLYDSILLLEFLARNNCYPSWIFAVKLEPWAAHCWVQSGTVAFNQDSDDARAYLPIMVVP